MLISCIHHWLTSPTEKITTPRSLFWFSLSLIFCLIFGIQALQEAFASDYVVQDDARQHVTWLLRFSDPDLFPNDLIADYYLSSEPFGYTALYQFFAAIGIDPILLSKVLPIGLGLLTTGYGYALALEMLPVPMTGFIATVMLNHMLWSKDILVGATPRAFSAIFFLAFLYYLLRRSLLPCLATIALQGLFYPPYVMIMAGILVLKLLHWERGLPHLSLEQSNFLLCGAGLGVALLVLLPYVLNPSEFGPTITAAQAKILPEFQQGGRTAFFGKDPWTFWFSGSSRSSLQIHQIFSHKIIWAGLLLPILLRYPSRFPLAKRVNPGVIVLIEMVLVSLGLFFAAHAVLFKLYLPSRYSQGVGYAIRLSTAIAVVLIFDALILRLEEWVFRGKEQGSNRYSRRQFLANVLAVFLAAILLIYPRSFLIPKNWSFHYGTEPQLYEFLARQPKDVLTASLASEASKLPTFARRSVLVAREFGIPYESGYYNQFRSRVIDLIEAQYSDDIQQVKAFVQKYGVDFWLLNRESFTPEYIRENSWIRQFQPAADEAVKKLEQGQVPVLAKSIERCSVFGNERLTLLEAKCLLKS